MPEDDKFLLGQILAKVEAGNELTRLVQADVQSLRADLKAQGDEHDSRLRALENMNLNGLRDQVKTFGERITVLEHAWVRIGAWSTAIGIVGSVAISEFVRRVLH